MSGLSVQNLLLNPLFAMWIACLCTLLLAGRYVLREKHRLRSILTSENGAAYSMSLALLTPLYTLMICFLIELTLMLNVQIGVDYAAFSAARSAIVWLPAEVTPLNSQQQLADMVHLAAAQAITPYASSQDKHRRSGSSGNSAAEGNYLTAYERLVTTSRPQQASYVNNKYQYALAATHVDFEPPLSAVFSQPTADNQLIKVTVTYEMPFHIPGVGLILGKESSSGIGRIRELTASTTLQLERPKTANGLLGFEYDSRPADSSFAANSAAPTAPTDIWTDEQAGSSSDNGSDSGSGNGGNRPGNGGTADGDGGEIADGDVRGNGNGDAPSDAESGSSSSLMDLIAELEKQLESETDPQRIEQLQENLQDAQVALEQKIFGESPTASQLWRDYYNNLGKPKKDARRYYGFSITGKLPLGIAEVNGTEAYLYDCETGRFHKYVGIGASGGVGAFVGFVIKPLTADLKDPKDFESVSVEGSGTVAFVFGGEIGGSASTDAGFSDLDFSLSSGVVVGIGASASGGDSFLVYRGTTSSFFLRWVERMLWGAQPCD